MMQAKIKIPKKNTPNPPPINQIKPLTIADLPAGCFFVKIKNNDKKNLFLIVCVVGCFLKRTYVAKIT